VLIRVGMPGAIDPNQPPGGGKGPDGKDPDDENDGEDADGRPEEPPTNAGPGTPDGSIGLGPIRGVRSRSKGESVKTLFGQTRYDRWQFTVELLQSGGIVNVGGAGVPAAGGPRMSAKWIGRPFRPGLQQPQGPQLGAPPPPPGQQ
jgi:hypothetical protein